MKNHKIIVIGAGLGGLAAAVRLAVKGFHVIVLESSHTFGGKIGVYEKSDFRWDTGPSLFTKPELFDELFYLAQKNPRDYYQYIEVNDHCQYFWEDGLQLTKTKDIKCFAKEVEAKTSENENQIIKYYKKSKLIKNIVSPVFLDQSLHLLKTYCRLSTLKSLFKIHQIEGLKSLHQLNKTYFKDHHLVQLFDRYATYNGSNPYKAPGTLSVIPSFEQDPGVFLPSKGIRNLPQSVYQLCLDLGVEFKFNTKVNSIIRLQNNHYHIQTDNTNIEAQDIVYNGDINYFYNNLLIDNNLNSKIRNEEKSTSGMVFYWGIKGIYKNLGLHNILFSKDYKNEFDELFNQNIIPSDPTVYINITSKYIETDAPKDCENWFVMVNTPAMGENVSEQDINQTRTKVLEKIQSTLNIDISNCIIEEKVLHAGTLQNDTLSFKGALYGNSSNTKLSAFFRYPNFSRKYSGLYFVGGTVHPGGGMPLVLMSAKIATNRIIAHYKL